QSSTSLETSIYLDGKGMFRKAAKKQQGKKSKQFWTPNDFGLAPSGILASFTTRKRSKPERKIFDKRKEIKLRCFSWKGWRPGQEFATKKLMEEPASGSLGGSIWPPALIYTPGGGLALETPGRRRVTIREGFWSRGVIYTVACAIRFSRLENLWTGTGAGRLEKLREVFGA
ncbi:hypothetical protein RRG08_045164, partial [Elysia crispata]